jgi:hypothetical protein
MTRYGEDWPLFGQESSIVGDEKPLSRFCQYHIEKNYFFAVLAHFGPARADLVFFAEV